MQKIKFSYGYPKLWGQTTAELLDVRILNPDKLNEFLLEYDTYYVDDKDWNGDMSWGSDNFYAMNHGYYPLNKKQKYIQLIFLGNYRIPFCTIRRFTEQKYEYYKQQIGKMFVVKINE
jgi:hypothetical protein